MIFYILKCFEQFFINYIELKNIRYIIVIKKIAIFIYIVEYSGSNCDIQSYY